MILSHLGGAGFSNPVIISSGGLGIDSAIVASRNNVHVVWESDGQSEFARITNTGASFVNIHNIGVGIKSRHCCHS
jgi:hypothetical protein